jgi:hypothetical protein
MDAQANRITINGLATNLACLLNKDKAPRGHSISRGHTSSSIYTQSKYYNIVPNSPIPSIERVYSVRNVPKYS